MRAVPWCVLILLLAGPTVAASEVADRERVDRALVAVLKAEGHATAEVNALLALGPDLVKPRLRERLRASRVRTSVAGRRRLAIETLAAILGGRTDWRAKGVLAGNEFFVRVAAAWVASAQVLEVIAPGEEKVFCYPLPQDLVEDARITARMRDDSAVEGQAPAPRLLDTPDLTVE